MKISIITVCKNPSESLKKTVESVFAQTYEKIEYIIVDGASTDGTVEWVSGLNREEVSSEQKNTNSSPNPFSLKERRGGILPSFSKREGLGASFKFLSEPDSGIYNAMNKGISLASGEYFLFLNAGDILFQNDVIQEVAETIEKDGRNNEIYFGKIVTEAINGERYEVPNKLNKISALKLFFWAIPHPAAFIRSDLLKNTGGYDENFKIAADREFFLRVYHLENVKIIHIPVTVSVFKTDGISSDRKNRLLMNKENGMIIKKHCGSFAEFVYNVKPLLVIFRFIYKIWLKFEKNH